ncbi:unnamed protein product, partial [Heterosigma akashiwo]
MCDEDCDLGGLCGLLRPKATQGTLDDPEHDIISKEEKALTQYDLGTALQEQRKLPEAIRCYKEAIQLNPALVDAHYNLGSAIQAQGNDEEALK